MVLKVVHISTSDRGGAGIAATRLHLGLLGKGIDSKLLTVYRFGSGVPAHYKISNADYSPFPVLTKKVNQLKKVLKDYGLYKPVYRQYADKYLKGRPPGFENFSFSFSEIDLRKHPLVKEADIVHLHWVSEGGLDFHSFFRGQNKKIAWTLHDMNPFTGGCHHADDSRGFMDKCEHCPQVKNTIDEDIAEKMLEQKKTAFSGISGKQFRVVTPSGWLGGLSRQSALFGRFEHSVIANGIDEHLFKPYDKHASRSELGLPQDKKIILFVAHHISNYRKGIHFLVQAFEALKTEEVLLCSIGSEANELTYLKNFRQIGYVKDDTLMAKAYSAADLFVLPSLAENFPNTICESLFCGTPVAGFNVGGIPEQINASNGILVADKNAEKLKEAIQNVLTHPHLYNSSAIRGQAVNKYALSRISQQYVDLYGKMLSG